MASQLRSGADCWGVGGTDPERGGFAALVRPPDRSSSASSEDSPASPPSRAWIQMLVVKSCHIEPSPLVVCSGPEGGPAEEDRHTTYLQATRAEARLSNFARAWLGAV